MFVKYKGAPDAKTKTLSEKTEIITINDENKNVKPKTYSEKKLDEFFSKFDSILQILQKEEENLTKVHEVFEFIKNCGKIFRYENVIPQIVESGMYDCILKYVSVVTFDVFDFLIQLVDCPFDDVILLLKNDIGLILIEGLNCQNDLIFQKSLKCFSTILLKRSQYIDDDAFLYLMIMSLNIIETIINRIKKIELDDDMMKLYMKFISATFEKMPSNAQINVEILNSLLENFLSECRNPEIFNLSIFSEIANKGISFVENSALYQLFVQSFSYATNYDDNQIIYDFCHIIFTLFNWDISTYTLILNNFNFLDYSEKWLAKNDPQIFYIYSIIISYLLVDPDQIESLSPEQIEKISSLVLYMFDSSSMINDDDIQYSIINSIFNLLYYKNILTSSLLEEKRIELICSKIIFCGYKIAQMCAYLYLAIASEVDDFSQMINDEVIEKIFGIMEKRKGNFVQSSLHYLDLILEKQQSQNKNDLFDLILQIEGNELINDMIDSEDENVSKQAYQISQKYFNQILN